MIKYVKAGKYPYLVVEAKKQQWLTAISGDFDHMFCIQTYPNNIDEDIFSVKLVSHHASCVFLFHLSKIQGIFLPTLFGNMRSPPLFWKPVQQKSHSPRHILKNPFFGRPLLWRVCRWWAVIALVSFRCEGNCETWLGKMFVGKLVLQGILKVR